LVFKHGNGAVEAVHQKKVAVPGFNSLEILRTCKQISGEAAQVLYGENYFVFDTRGNAADPSRSFGERERGEFEALRYRIPGLEDRWGNSPSQGQVKRAIERLFDKKSYLPKFAFEDPLMRFFYEIGRENAKRLTKVKIEGHLNTRFRDETDRRPAGLGRVLPIYTLVLKDVCKDLRSLTLHMGYSEDYLYMGSSWGHGYPTFPLPEKDDAPRDKEKSEEEKIDAVVERVVRGLPGLRHLQLGDYKKAEMRDDDLEWGKARRWMGVVKERGESTGNGQDGEVAEIDAEVPQRGNRRVGRRGGFRGRERGGRRGGRGGRAGRGDRSS
jgi:hypothetical protein